MTELRAERAARRFTIVGAGAMGGTLGAYLVRNGMDVQFVDANPEHVVAMQQRGLTIDGFDGAFTVPVRARMSSAIDSPLDVVLLAVKAQHTEPAVRELLPWLTPDSAVVSLQNGLCEVTIRRLVGQERTIGAFVNYSADYIAPGLIRYAGPGAFCLGELDGATTPRVVAIAQALSVWAPVEVTSNIWGYLWGKMGYMNMVYATALADADQYEVIDRYRPLMVELACEMFDVAESLHITPMPFNGVEPRLYFPREQQNWTAIDASLDRLVQHSRLFQKARSGVWRDIMVWKRKTEIDQQLVVAVGMGDEAGLTTPLTRALVTMIHELECGTRTMDWANLDTLDRPRRA